MSPNRIPDEWLVDRLDRLEEKVDKMIDSQTSLLLQVGHNTHVLAEHQRRSLANEKSQATLESFTKEALAKFGSELKPLVEAKTARALIAKWTSGVGGALGVAYTVARLMGWAH